MKLKSSISFVMRLLIALIFIQTLYYKFTAHPDSVYIFSQLGVEPFGRIALGIIELVVAVFILVPRTSVVSIIMALGIITGAIGSHLLVIGTEVRGDGGVLFALAVVVFILCLLLSIVHFRELKEFMHGVKTKLMLRVSILMLCSSSMAMGCAQQSSSEALTDSSKQSIVQATDSAMRLTEQEWKARLTPEQYYVLRQKGTEYPHTGAFVLSKDKGTYSCAGCGEPLFSDDMKFDSHCGWPSFDREIAGGKIIQTEDHSAGMRRTEISCARCGGHLGHIFDDGPTETGQRYCVNSVSLAFEPQVLSEGNSNVPTEEVITLGGGCFWCIEAVFEQLDGVSSVESGYSGGAIEAPSYRDVCNGNTGHAEVVQVSFDPAVITLTEILEVFFTVHDPTSLNRQGADVGTQYRSVIFYHSDEQRSEALRVINTLEESKVLDAKIVTEVSAYKAFYKAEQYHQAYYELHKQEPYCKAVILPKVNKLHSVFASKLKKS